MRLGKTEEVMDGRDRAIDEDWGVGGKSKVEWELEFATDGGDAANDVGAVDRTGIPGVSGAMDCFHKDLVGTSIIASDSDTTVENAEEALNTHSFVVAASSRMEFQFEQFAHGFEKAAKSTTGVDNNHTGETDREEKLLHENVGEIGGGNVREALDYDHAGKVTHGGEDVSGAVRDIGGVTGLPKIDMKDVKRAADGPREQKLAVATDSVFSKDAVGALPNPIQDVGAEFWPEEAEADAMQSLVFFRVSSSWGGMVSGEDVTAKWKRNNDEQESAAVGRNILTEGEAAVQ